MTFAAYMTPVKRLHLLAVQAIRESRRSVDRATPRFFNLIAEDPDLMLELVGRDVMRDIARQFLQETFDRDMNGGGIGLRPVDETGGNAVADDAGHNRADAQDTCARPSAPQTPPEMAVGGGQKCGDTQAVIASPSSPPQPATAATPAPRAAVSLQATVAQRSQPARTEAPEALYLKKPLWSPGNITPAQEPEAGKVPVNKHWRNPPGKGATKAPYVAPKERVSAEAQLKTKNLVAASVLETTVVRGKAIGKWRKDEALSLAERMDWDSKVLTAFCSSLPKPDSIVEDFITVREAENIMKTLEANRAA